MKPRILIDAIALLSPLTGIGRYTYENSKYLQRNKEVKFFFYYGYHSEKILEPLNSDTKESKLVIIGNKIIRKLKYILSKSNLIKKIARKILVISSNLFAPRYDLYWQPNFIPNDGIKETKIVTTVHDFSFILHKDFHPKERIEHFEDNFLKNIYRSDMILTGSEYSKQEILQRLDFDESKVKVIYHAVNHQLFKVYKNIEVPFKIPKKFILSVGSIEPRKNLIGLLKAYDILDENLKEEYKLVLVGFKGWENKEIMDIIENNKQNIHYLGFVTDEELAKVYNLASLFVFPSFYEGFGLPPLEAMACGTPVVSSNLTSMPEVCLDAAVYCNPSDVVDIKEKIQLVLNDSDLQNTLITKGLKRASEFTWEKAASKHLEVFKEVLDS